MAEDFDEALATNFYFDRNFNCQAAKVLPGEYYVTGKDMLLVTVLGSCVAACIRDRDNGIGGMNHYMLPDGGTDENNPSSSSARYGSYAMEILINQILKLGARRSHLEAKVFGGGNVLAGLTRANVGHRNAEFVLRYLNTEGIRIAARDLDDVFARKVYYFPATGRALVKRLTTLRIDTLLLRETDYRKKLVQAPAGGDIELFN